MTSTMLPRMATDRFATGLAIAATLIATLCISTATTTQAQQSAQPRCPAGYWLLEPVMTLSVHPEPEAPEKSRIATSTQTSASGSPVCASVTVPETVPSGSAWAAAPARPPPDRRPAPPP